jgi:hypothetical protein
MLTASNSFLLMHKFIFIANFSQAEKIEKKDRLSISWDLQGFLITLC